MIDDDAARRTMPLPAKKMKMAKGAAPLDPYPVQRKRTRLDAGFEDDDDSLDGSDEDGDGLEVVVEGSHIRIPDKDQFRGAYRGQPARTIRRVMGREDGPSHV